MAHRANLVQVSERLSSTTDLELIRDPVCGVEKKRTDFKTILFRSNRTFYFCGKDCLNQFLHPDKEKRWVA
jgi:hypothetical protein